jgi:hypothetical protein
VTFNLDDFPALRLAPYNIETKRPDDFVIDTIDISPGAVTTVIAEQGLQAGIHGCTKPCTKRGRLALRGRNKASHFRRHPGDFSGFVTSDATPCNTRRVLKIRCRESGLRVQAPSPARTVHARGRAGGAGGERSGMSKENPVRVRRLVRCTGKGAG